MSFLRRLLGRGEPEARRAAEPVAVTPGGEALTGATPGQMLDYLEEHREAAEAILLRRHHTCPECSSNYLRLGAWASRGRAGWTVSCVNCGLVLEQTTEIDG